MKFIACLIGLISVTQVRELLFLKGNNMINEENNQKINILLVEYDPVEAKRITDILQEYDNKIELKWVQTLSDAIKNVQKGVFNEILLSLDLPDSKGKHTLSELRRIVPQLPIVLITESPELDLIQNGADDLLYKKYLDPPLILKTIFYAIDKKKNENKLKSFQEKINYQKIERSKDISREKDELKRLKRTYRIVSNINRIALGVDNTKIFLSEINKILIETVGFSTVWIGKLDHEKNVLDIISFEGTSKLVNREIDLNDPAPSFQDITKTILTGKHFIVNDITNIADVDAGISDVRNISYKSYASFPIFIDNKIWGSIHLYSPKNYFFTTQEVRLFEDLSKDISNAISSFLKRKEGREDQRKIVAEELKYRNLFEKNLAGIYRTSFDGKVLDANDTLVKMLGFKSLDELKKRNFDDFFEQSASREEFIKNLLVKGYLANHLHKLKRKDGNILWVLKNVLVLKDELTGEKVIQSTVVDVTKMHSCLNELKTSENILKIIANTASQVLQLGKWRYSINNNLKKLGEICQVSRVYLFENYTDKEGTIYSTQKIEWVKSGITAHINNPELKNLALKKAGFERWIKILSKGNVIKGKVEDFPEGERKLLESQGVKSILVLPIFVNRSWWGFIGFDNCEEVRKWNKSEEEALKIISKLIGISIQRSILEKELKLREMRLKQTTMIAGIGHFEYDFVKNKMIFSEGIYNILKIDKKNAINSFEEILDYIHPEDRKLVSENYNYAISSGKPGNFITRIIMQDKSIKKIWVKWETNKNKKGKVILLRGIAMDITERKQAEEHILKLSHAVEHSPALVYITDNQEKIEYANKKFTEVTGYKLSDVKGKKPSFWSSGIHDEDFYEEMLDTIYSGKEWTGEIKNRKKNGDYFWQWTSISPLINDDGDITHFVAVSLDITEKKQMIEDLRRAKEKAEKSDNLKSEFLAQISHEIRTPINVITNYISLIEDEEEEIINEDIKYAFEGIKEESKRIIRSIELVLNASEIITKNYSPQLETLDLSSIIYEKYITFKNIAEKKGLSMNFTCSTNETIIKIDKFSISQMVENLLDNAVKFTERGEINISLAKNNDKRLILEIEDTGIGMDSLFLEDIFNPFTQEDSGLTRSFDGMGLGSTLIKHYADINNVAIKIQSTKDIGTTFEIIFNIK